MAEYYHFKSADGLSTFKDVSIAMIEAQTNVLKVAANVTIALSEFVRKTVSDWRKYIQDEYITNIEEIEKSSEDPQDKSRKLSEITAKLNVENSKLATFEQQGNSDVSSEQSQIQLTAQDQKVTAQFAMLASQIVSTLVSLLGSGFA